ncbi:MULTISPECIES: hypothetical protein [Pseudomonadaceae]|uniref:hypothetical protein n=1 Tax=Pseudomonadaceae TaxID=135621 RepID=UPI00280B376F|nr:MULTISPECIES: hypothetical protein [Pseudomonas]MDU9400674.1 hypothetical protein [Pseudomonas sp. zfem003]
MSDEPSFVWTWYGQDEHAWVLASCKVMQCLEFLALEAPEQAVRICGCPGCETWSGKVLPLHGWLKACPGSQVPQFRDALQKVWALCNELPDAALGCYEHDIYHCEEWEAVRLAARAALAAGGWDSVREHIEGITTTCNRHLLPWGHRPA